MNKDDVFIDSVGFLQKKLAEEHSIVAKPSLVKSILRQDLKMRYKLVKPVSWTTNTAKSKIVRQ